MVWQDGFPIGNGFLGAMVWGDGQPLKFTLDCADLWDNRTGGTVLADPAYHYRNLRRLIKNKRYDEADKIFGATGANKPYPTKISIGRAELDLGAAHDYACRLNLDRAVVEGQFKINRRRHGFLAFVAKTRHVLCIRVKNLPKYARFKLRPLMEICPAMVGLAFPPPEFTVVRLTSKSKTSQYLNAAEGLGSAGKIHVMTQAIPDGLCYAVGWVIYGENIFIAVEVGDAVKTAAQCVAATLESTLRAGFEKLYCEHVRVWRKFWRASAVVLPEPEAEFYWYYGIYLLASSAKRGHLPPGLQGLWAMDGVLPPWRGDYHNDLNVQETFWPAGVSGHIELLDVWCDFMLERLPAIKKYTRRVFGTEGAFWPCVLYGKSEPGSMSLGNWYVLCFGWSHGLWLGWMIWLRWRYSLDKNWLREVGYPLLSEIFVFVRANLVTEADGHLHVPLSCSPEYRGDKAREAFCKDPNVDLALIRKCCDWIVEMEAALGVRKLTAAARKIQKTLVPYALSDKNELCLWPGKLLDESHRHPSQLMAVHPAMDLTIDGDACTRAIIHASITQYLGLGQFQWVGHTYAQLISMAAVLGQGEWAYDCLRQFMTRWTMPNGLHLNSDWRGTGASFFGVLSDARNRNRVNAPFTMEANNAVSAGIGDMLVQGWGDKVRVFPAVPAHWRDAAFFDLRTEGGWKVSAVRQCGRTVWVRVEAAVDRRLVLVDPFDGASAKISRPGMCLKDGLYCVNLRRGDILTLCWRGYVFNRRRVVAAVRASHPSLLGLPPAPR